jgi:hypothetical protein
MDSDLLDSQMQYIERNGCCLNIDEKMRLTLAFQELKTDLNLSAIWLTAKITGKYILNRYHSFRCHQGLFPVPS